MRLAILSDYPLVRAGLRTFAQRVGAGVVLEAPVVEARRLAKGDITCDLIALDIGTTPPELVAEVCRAAASASGAPPVIGIEWRSPASAGRPIGAGLAAAIRLPCDTQLDIVGSSVVKAAKSTSPESQSGALEPAAHYAGPQGDISATDAHILRLLVDGHHDGEIAAELSFAPSTVRHRLEALRKHHGLRTRAQLAAWAVARGLVSPGKDW